MVFQRYALFPHMNVFDNVAFSQVLKGRPRPEIARKVGEMLALVALTGYEGRRVNQLSGGQAQRVALARALINEPRVLLLDEPLGALDLQIRKQMQLELKGIQARLGTNFIYVTHDQEEAMVMSDRIVLMNLGQIVQVGTPEELYNSPSTVFAARFIGETNVLAGEVREAGQAGVAVAVGGLLVHALPRPDLAAGRQVALSVRPERIGLAGENGAERKPNRATGTVTARIFLGSAVKYEVDLAGAGAKVVVIRPAAEGGEARRPGEQVELAWSREDAVIVAEGENP
jgi:spermidine/putrescine transport system ATP-binding protein